MKTLVFLAAVVALSAARTLSDPRDLALQNPDLFGGDMMGIDPSDRNAIPTNTLRWTGNLVPYVIDGSLFSQNSLIQQAMSHIASTTCIRFAPRSTERNYISIFMGQGCYSYVGMINQGSQQLSLGQGCHYIGTVVHELLHAIGFYHEQNRSDRDSYIVVYWQNIQQGMESQFQKMQASQNRIFDNFDYNSVMLYGEYAFSKDRVSKTMEDVNRRYTLKEPYDKTGMTSNDINRVKWLYGC